MITGYVYQPERRRIDGIDRPVYVPVANARVSGEDAGGQAFVNGSQVEAVTGADGRFTLFDPRYNGGPFTLHARHTDGDGNVRETSASGFESDPQDAKALAVLPQALRPYPNRAVLNLSFDLVEAPPPAPDINITVCELVASGCQNRADGALVGRRLRIGVDVPADSALTVNIGEVNGAPLNVANATGPDQARTYYELQAAGDGSGTAFTPSTPGSYVVRVRATTPLGDPRVETLTFRVFGSTGAITPLPSDAPQIITRKSNPPDGATNVSVANLYPEVYFTEPVTGLVPGGTVKLEESGGAAPVPVEFDMMGVGLVSGNPRIVRPVLADSLMTSITLKPRRGLKLGTQYTLSLTPGIVDTDSPAKPLEPVQITFTTFRPSVLGSEGGFGSPGIGVVGNLAFVVKNNFYNGFASVWDVADPTQPRNLTTTPLVVAPRPIDVSADPTGEPMAAVSVVSTNVSKPSSVIFVSGEDPRDPRMAGAVTVAPSAIDGFISRSAFHKGFVYLATTKKGVQVIDASMGSTNIPNLATMFQARSAISTDGHGFGEEALVRTIPYPAGPGGRLVHMTDIVAADIQGQALVAATGTLPLLLVDPQFGVVTASWQPNEVTFENGLIQQGYALGLGRVGAWDLAAVAVLMQEPGGTSKVRLITVNVRDASDPQILGAVDLEPSGSPLDVTLRGTTAVVTTQENDQNGEAIIVELVDPANPYVKGRVAGAGGRAAINQEGQIVTTASSPFGGATTPLGGIKSLVLESACVGLGSLETRRVVQYRIYDPVNDRTHVEDARIVLDLCQRSEVTLRVAGIVLTTIVDNLAERALDALDLAGGRHSFRVPRNLLPLVTDERPFTVTIRSVVDEEERTLEGVIVGELRNRPMLPVSHTFVKGVDLFDGHLALGATDMQVKGRHFTLDLSRSYSSAGLGEGRSGWYWTYDSLVAVSDRIYSVTTADGSSQRFTEEADGTFKPQKGYHSKLERGADGELIFIDKAANRHTFRAGSSDAWETGPWRLVSIREPHGDELRVKYNAIGRVDSVKEYWSGSETEAASLTFTYEPFRAIPPGQKPDPADMALRSVVGAAASRGLNLLATYEHSPAGELTAVTRSGRNIAGGQDAQDEVWRYAYEPVVGRDSSRLRSVTDPDNHVTSYTYIEGPFSPSEGDVSGRPEFVKTVTQVPGNGVSDVVTTFDYGTRSASATSSSTTVKDARGFETEYTMNQHGGVTHIAEPLGRTTVVEWMTTDALKKKEILPGGLVKDYEYDVNGNLIKETATGVDGLTTRT